LGGDEIDVGFSGVKRWLRRFIPERRALDRQGHLRLFGTLLQDPNLWHLNRRSASGAFAVGLFVMYLPPLGQMLIAAAGAIVFRVNLPISVALVWISNPLTIPPMYYFSYRIGSWVLGQESGPFRMELWLDWRHWIEVLGPLAIGGLICGTVCAIAGYLAVQGIWRWNLMRQIRLRRARLTGAPPRKPPRMPARGAEDTK
jgi:uncharacterized protein